MRLSVWLGAIATTVLIVLVFGVRGTKTTNPPLEIFDDMKRQPKYHAQGESAFFADRRDMRTPPRGTVAYGGSDYASDAGRPTQNPDMLQADDLFYRGTTALDPKVNDAVGAASVFGVLGSGRDPAALARAEAARVIWESKPRVWVRGIPAQVTAPDDPRWQLITREFLRRGQEQFKITCALCHGTTGQADGITTKHGMVGVANLHDDDSRRIVQMPDGELFNVITNGKQTMKGYGAQIKPADRWAIVAYVRALQLSQRAPKSSVLAEQLRELDKMP